MTPSWILQTARPPEECHQGAPVNARDCQGIAQLSLACVPHSFIIKRDDKVLVLSRWFGLFCHVARDSRLSGDPGGGAVGKDVHNVERCSCHAGGAFSPPQAEQPGPPSPARPGRASILFPPELPFLESRKALDWGLLALLRPWRGQGNGEKRNH